MVDHAPFGQHGAVVFLVVQAEAGRKGGAVGLADHVDRQVAGDVFGRLVPHLHLAEVFEPRAFHVHQHRQVIDQRLQEAAVVLHRQFVELARADVARGDGHAVADRHDLVAQPARAAVWQGQFEFVFQRLARLHHQHEAFEEALVAQQRQQRQRALAQQFGARLAQHFGGALVDVGEDEVFGRLAGRRAPGFQQHHRVEAALVRRAQQRLRVLGLADAAPQPAALAHQQGGEADDQEAGGQQHADIQAAAVFEMGQRGGAAHADHRQQRIAAQVAVAVDARDGVQRRRDVRFLGRMGGRARHAKVDLVADDQLFADAADRQAAVARDQHQRAVFVQVEAVVVVDEIGGVDQDHDGAGKTAVAIVQAARRAYHPFLAGGVDHRRVDQGDIAARGGQGAKESLAGHCRRHGHWRCR